MSERIDHVAEAIGLRQLAATGDSNSRGVGNVLAAAQVHATLALVEQQRIANLIALGQAKNADGSFIRAGAITHPVDGWSVAVNDDIREALGL